MPERVNKKFRKVDSAEVQGEGSWIIIRNLGFDILSGQKDSGLLSELQAADSNMDLAYRAVKAICYEWNWVDDNGKPFPQPKDDPEVFDELTVKEQWFILQAAELDKLGDLVKDSKK